MLPEILAMNAMYSVRDFEQAEDTYFETGDAKNIIDTFEGQLELLPYLKFTNFIMLGEPTPDQFVVLKHLVYLFKKRHHIEHEHVFIQSETGPNDSAEYMKRHGFTMMYDGDNIRDDIRGARLAIWNKINTFSVVVAPSVQNHILHQALNTTGIGLLICKDINDIVDYLYTQDLLTTPGSIFDFFERVRQAGHKIRMPLLEGGSSWCPQTSIHRVGIGYDFESRKGLSQGWTRMKNPPKEIQGNQSTCPEAGVPRASTPENNGIA